MPDQGNRMNKKYARQNTKDISHKSQWLAARQSVIAWYFSVVCRVLWTE
jgi:hypothetical protein